MIRSIELKNFKCFDEVTVDTKKLTIIAGSNGAGKSSIIQGLLLLRQSSLSKEILPSALRLKGELVDLESASAIRCSPTEDASVTLTIDDSTLSDSFSATVADATTAATEPACELSDNFGEAQEKSALFDDSFVYLYANRLSPESSYQKGPTLIHNNRLGDRTGNNTLFRLQQAFDKNEEVECTSLIRGKDSLVTTNVNAWVSHIMGHNIKLQANSAGSDALSLEFRPEGQEPVSALNMAFGHTYILPIVVGLLTAPKDSLFIIENPEAHLHPKAQARMGELLATAATAGVQIIIETHSDHLLNGVRVAVKKQILAPDEVSLHFFYTDSDGDHLDNDIEVLDGGALRNWPEGFFDEWEVALKDLLD